MSKSLAGSALFTGATVLSNYSNSHRQSFTGHRRSLAPPSRATRGLSLRKGFSGPPELTLSLLYITRTFAGSGVLIGLLVLSFDSDLRRQFAANALAPFDSQLSIVGPQGLEIIVFFMSKANALAPFDSQRSIVGPQGLEIIVFFMSKNLAESAVVIGLMLLSFNSNWFLHRFRSHQRSLVLVTRTKASKPSSPFDFQQSIVETPGLARMVFYMSKKLA
jgi:hypothetical protein